LLLLLLEFDSYYRREAFVGLRILDHCPVAIKNFSLARSRCDSTSATTSNEKRASLPRKSNDLTTASSIGDNNYHVENDERLALCLSEIEVIATSQHPNIVGYLESYLGDREIWVRSGKVVLLKISFFLSLFCLFVFYSVAYDSDCHGIYVCWQLIRLAALFATDSASEGGQQADR
jgi:hypothetical protein